MTLTLKVEATRFSETLVPVYHGIKSQMTTVLTLTALYLKSNTIFLFY
jgi:hypothetical protein